MWKNFDDHLSFSFPYSICRSPFNYGLKNCPKIVGNLIISFL
jgi:hypothetical protein